MTHFELQLRAAAARSAGVPDCEIELRRSADGSLEAFHNGRPVPIAFDTRAQRPDIAPDRGDGRVRVY